MCWCLPPRVRQENGGTLSARDYWVEKFLGKGVGLFQIFKVWEWPHKTMGAVNSLWGGGCQRPRLHLLLPEWCWDQPFHQEWSTVCFPSRLRKALSGPSTCSFQPYSFLPHRSKKLLSVLISTMYPELRKYPQGDPHTLRSLRSPLWQDTHPLRDFHTPQPDYSHRAPWV